MTRLPLFAVSLAAPLLAAGAAVANCSLPYEKFEFSVAHIDLDQCPADVKPGNVFCRANVGTDSVHVFVFARDADKCLLETRSYEKDRFEIRFK